MHNADVRTFEVPEHLRDDPEPIHGWFGLSYANYLVLPRAVLQSMPQHWQARFVACLGELEAAVADLEYPNSYHVQARDEYGRFVKDPTPHYSRGRTRVPVKDVWSDHEDR